MAVIELADEICETCFHLIITCNKEGNLASYDSASDKFVITLPKESNDVSLAITSSYSAILLTGLLVTKIATLEASKDSMEAVIK